MFILSDHADFMRVSKLLKEYEQSHKVMVAESATKGGYYFWARVRFISGTKFEEEFFAELGDIVQETTRAEIDAYERGFANAFAKKK